MALDVSGSNEAKNLGTWLLSAGGVLGLFAAVNKFLRSGPVKALEKRMEKLESNVEDKFQQLSSQRTLDVSNLRSDMASQNVELAKITVLLAAQTKAFDSFVARIDEAADKRHHR